MPRVCPAEQPGRPQPTAAGAPEPQILAVSVELPARVAEILDLVEEIPPGRVCTYGDLGGLTGGRARYVGWVLSRYGHLVPWWRVVSASGDLPPALRERAAARWREEGTPVRSDGSVDLPRARLARP